MKRIFTFIGIFGLILPLQAQNTSAKEDTTIQKNIEIVKEYNPVIKEAGKINTLPELKEITTTKKNSELSVWTTPFPLEMGEIPTLDYAGMEPAPQPNIKKRYARVGGGNYASVLGELYTPIWQNKRNLIDIHALHNSSFGKVTLTPKMYEEQGLESDLKSKATTNKTNAKITYTRDIKNKELSAFAFGNYNYFKYYGFDSDKLELAKAGYTETDNDSCKQAFLKLGANVRFRSKDYISRWKYDVQTNYNYFSNREKLREHTIHTLLNGGYRFENSSLSVDLDVTNIIMTLPESTDQYTFVKGNTMNNYTVIKLKPSYYFSGNIGEINVGVKGAFSINQGKKGAVTPDVFGKVKLIKDIMAVYAGVTGDYIINNFQSITEENQYIAPDTRIQDTYMPIDAYVGLTLKIAKRVDMDIHAGYKLIDNPYFFINRCDTTGNFRNVFDVVYDKKAGLLDAGISFAYNWNQRLDLRVSGTFNKWSLSNKIEEAWYKPKWKLDFEGSFLATDYLRFRLGYQLEAGKYACINGNKVSLPTSNNLFFGADYKVLNWLNLFVNIDNIIAQEYQTWYGYTNHRFNILGGLAISF